MDVHNYVLIALSGIFMLAHIIWLLVRCKRLRVSELMMLSILVTFLGSIICYALSVLPAGRDMVGCRAITAMYQFFFLASITWTNSLAISITMTIFNYRPSNKSIKRYFAFACYAFGLPLSLVLITFALSVEQRKGNIPIFTQSVYREKDICFLQETIVIYTLFLGPVYLLTLANFGMCAASIVRVTRSVKVTNNDKNRVKKNIITCIKLSVCLGLGWILLFAATAFRQLWPILQIFVEIQGVLIVCTNITNWNCVNSLGSRLSRTLSMTRSTNISSKAFLDMTPSNSKSHKTEAATTSLS